MASLIAVYSKGVFPILLNVLFIYDLIHEHCYCIPLYPDSIISNITPDSPPAFLASSHQTALLLSLLHHTRRPSCFPCFILWVTAVTVTYVTNIAGHSSRPQRFLITSFLKILFRYFFVSDWACCLVS